MEYTKDELPINQKKVLDFIDSDKHKDLGAVEMCKQLKIHRPTLDYSLERLEAKGFIKFIKFRKLGERIKRV